MTQADQVVRTVVCRHHVIDVHRRESSARCQCAADNNRQIAAAECVRKREVYALVQQNDAHRLACRDQRKRILRIALIDGHDQQALAHMLGVGAQLLDHIIKEALAEVRNDHHDQRAGLAASTERIRGCITGLLGHLLNAQAHRLTD